MATVCAAAALALLVAAGAGSANGSSAIAPAAAFESPSLIESDEEPAEALVFDRSQLPSSYESAYVERWEHPHLKIVRPYDGASFPPNMSAPDLRWEDRAGNLWMVRLSAPGMAASVSVITDRKSWRPDPGSWRALREAAAQDWIEMEVRGCVVQDGRRVGDEVYVHRVRFRVSEHPADPLIIYRLVTPLFHAFKTPDICYRDISIPQTRTFLPSKGAFCTNCHVFPSSPAIHAEDLRMAVAVRRSFSGLRLLGIYNFGSRDARRLTINSFFMSWDPDGTKVAVTGGQSITVKAPITLETQEFHVLVGDILIVDSETLEVAPLPGAASAEFIETFPAWSPDGETIVFARDKEIDPDKPVTRKRYDLYTVPFNDGEGGEITPLKGASFDGVSNFSPRNSPDGKWTVFTKAETASLVEPTADLWIASTAQGAEARKLECNADFSMDSHHSWSSNNRWLLFANKRDDGIFARVYITEIDEQGHASPPVALPAVPGEEMTCYNVPEFLRIRPEIDPEDILKKVSYLEQ